MIQWDEKDDRNLEELEELEESRRGLRLILRRRPSIGFLSLFEAYQCIEALEQNLIDLQSKLCEGF